LHRDSQSKAFVAELGENVLIERKGDFSIFGLVCFLFVEGIKAWKEEFERNPATGFGLEEDLKNE